MNTQGDYDMSKKGLTPEEVKPLLVGVANIQLTPFKSATEIDEEALRDNTRFMIEGGIVNGRGFQAIGGSNGEGFSMSMEEYKQLIDIVVDEAAGRVPICVGCIRPATMPVIRIAQYAEEVGADAVMVLAPHYYPYCSADAVHGHFKALADATNIGIMIYNNVTVTGQDLSVDLLRRLGAIDNIVAIKECTPNMSKLREVAYELKDRFAVIPNAARWLMPFDYQLGAVGYITIYGNVDPAYALRMHDVCLSGDFERAQDMWAKARGLANFIYTQGFDRTTAFAKEMARIAGRPMGSFERLPLMRPPEDERRKLHELMIEAGMTVAPGSD
jgi:4-hydroxy-tetrahydrodipicolinate synthase